MPSRSPILVDKRQDPNRPADAGLAGWLWKDVAADERFSAVARGITCALDGSQAQELGLHLKNPRERERIRIRVWELTDECGERQHDADESLRPASQLEKLLQERYELEQLILDKRDQEVARRGG